MNNNPIKQIILAIVVILVFIMLYFLLNKLTSKKNNDYEEFLKDYEVNEYISSYVTDEDMVKIYLNDYIHTMYYNVEEAYYLLDEEYRIKRFGSIENYKNYVYSLDYTTYDMVSYYKKSVDGYIIFGVYDQNGNFYAFKTKGVMQYSVYLDDNTVEIW